MVGTHALFQEDVAFKDLGLAVIDEQHRFGVDQRLALSDKGPDADVLVMTATPIPRTLVLSFYGDVALSELREKPARPKADQDDRRLDRQARSGNRCDRRRDRQRRSDLLDLPTGQRVR